MLALLFDLAGAYLIARTRWHGFIQFLLTIVVAVLSVSIANALLALFGVFTSGQALIRAISGLLVHWIVALVALLVCRRIVANRMATGGPAWKPQPDQTTPAEASQNGDMGGSPKGGGA